MTTTRALKGSGVLLSWVDVETDHDAEFNHWYSHEHIPERAGPMVVAVGASESAEFRRQSRDFHAAWTGSGLPGSYLEPAGKNHFTVLEELEDPASELHRALVRLARAP